MEVETVECKLITPMLMHGEDTTVAELRPRAVNYHHLKRWWLPN